MSAGSPPPALEQRRVAADVNATRPPPLPSKQVISKLELRQITIGLRAQELSLVLGALLIFAGILAAFIAARTTAVGIAPFGLIGGGVALLRMSSAPSMPRTPRSRDWRSLRSTHAKR